MVAGVRKTSPANRPPLLPLGGQGSRSPLPPWAARQGRAQERLANGRGHRRARSARGPTAAQLRQVGRRRGARRPALLRGRAPRGRGERGAHRGRDRLPQEGRKERWCGPPVHGHCGRHGQLSGRGVPRLLLREGSGILGPGALPAQSVDERPRKEGRGRRPEGVVFRNKVELAQELLERAFEADVPAGWVLADSFYGRSHTFRAWLEERGSPYAVMVPKTNSVPLGGRKKKIERLVERLPKDAFSEVRPARNTDGGRPWEWACLDLAADPKKG